MTEAFVEGAIELGLPRNDDLNGPDLDGAGRVQVTQRRGVRWTSADAYLAPAEGRPNLTLVTRAHATRILFQDRRAVAVEYVKDGARHRADLGREVIVSGGVVGSPQLLLLSGVGPGAHLHERGIATIHDLPGVGRNLHDHVGVGVLARATQPLSLRAGESLASMAHYALFRRGILTSNGAEACAFMRTRPDLAAPDLEVVFAPVGGTYRQLFYSPRSWLGGRALALAGRAAPGRFDALAVHGMAFATTPLVCKSVGYLELASPDPMVAPVIDPNYLSDPGGEDLALLLAGIRFARRLCRTAAMAPYVGEELLPGAGADTDEDLERFVRAHAVSAHHGVGTCRMGRDAMAVVDPELRVHGVRGVRVVDASVMPMMMRGHPYAATIMIAEKAADLILGSTAAGPLLDSAQATAAASSWASRAARWASSLRLMR